MHAMLYVWRQKLSNLYCKTDIICKIKRSYSINFYHSFSIHWWFISNKLMYYKSYPKNNQKNSVKIKREINWIKPFFSILHNIIPNFQTIYWVWSIIPFEVFKCAQSKFFNHLCTTWITFKGQWHLSLCTIKSKINGTLKGVYLPISKLHSTLAIAKLLAYNTITISYYGQVNSLRLK